MHFPCRYIFIFLVLFFTTATAMSQTNDPTTGRCAWNEPETGRLLVCPEMYPNCSKYEGVCYRYDSQFGKVEACRWDYKYWGGVLTLCSQLAPPPPVQDPTSTPPTPAPPVPSYDSQLRCSGGFTQNTYANTGGILGNLIESKQTETISLAGPTGEVFYMITCDNLNSAIDGRFRFRSVANGTIAVILDGETVYEKTANEPYGAQADEFSLVIAKGSHTFEIQYVPSAGSNYLLTDWALSEAYTCLGFDFPDPLQTTIWQNKVTMRTYNKMNNNGEKGSLIDETTRENIFLKDTSGMYSDLVIEYEGTTTIFEEGDYMVTIGNSGYFDTYINDSPKYFNGGEISEREPKFIKKPVFFQKGENKIRIVFKARSECSLAYFNIGEHVEKPENGGICLTMTGATPNGKILGCFLLLIAGLGLIRNHVLNFSVGLSK